MSKRLENLTHTSGTAPGRFEKASIRAGQSSVGTASATFATIPTHITRWNQISDGVVIVFIL
jgi:hypothetical protein